MPLHILGINAYHGDAAAAIIRDGRIVAAVEEERFNRVKHCAGFPLESVRFCLKAAGITIEDVDHVGISRDPSAHLHKKVLFAATRAARQLAVGTPRSGVVVASIEEETSTDGNGARPQRNSNGGGLFHQIKDRLGNAAKVRDLKDELAQMFGVRKDRASPSTSGEFFLCFAV
jgi:predicted NodU family carbamoyl transferase